MKDLSHVVAQVYFLYHKYKLQFFITYFSLKNDLKKPHSAIVIQPNWNRTNGATSYTTYRGRSLAINLIILHTLFSQKKNV